MNEVVTALLPMKGHSERVPGKNLRQMCGKPLFAWVLEALDASRYIDKIVINTDSDEIAELASGLGDVVIHPRPLAICGDLVSMNRIIEHDIGLLTQSGHFLQTHSTNPLLTTGTVDAAIERYFTSLDSFDSLFSVTRHQARFFDASGDPVNHDLSELARTQDLPPLYEENSNIYMFSRESFEIMSARIGARPQLFETDPLESLDIDEEADWQLAEQLLSNRLERGR